MSTHAERLVGLAALAEPLRRRLYLFVSSAADAVSRDVAAEQVGVPRSVAAFHLDKLAEVGLLEVEYRRPPGRTGPGAGRPAKFYRRTSCEVAFSIPPREYELAGRILAEALTVAEGDHVPVAEALRTSARAVGRSIGERASRDRAGTPGDGPSAVDVMTACGYEPQVEGDAVMLCNCPFHALAEDYRDLVCGMNLDLITGVLEAMGPAAGERGEHEDLEARLEPAPGRCCVRLVRTGAASARHVGAA